MVTKFNTGGGLGGNSSKMLLTLALVGVGAFLAYKFVYKPYMDKKSNESGS
jgi:hypothetical protein